ncbi:uncharacterized protein LOC132651548 [Meriones unguiculatus]|uniref:uncharacterized protein LOC132651548 n=1 Tax=Meriones unguiculatus TaxID=10047 RepID=UPI00293E568F|nr:uncharacterized protein LOC132651548 [Meriones unguiculatus]
MLMDPTKSLVMKKGLFIQHRNMAPFYKWVLCGINGSCTDLNPLGFISGGTVGKSIVMGALNGTVIKKAMEMVNVTRQITHWNRTITNQMAFPPSPVCVYPPFLLVLSNNSFRNCTNETCWMLQCWNARRYTRALVVRVPQWIPIPVETPSTLSLFRQKRDFGITAAIVTAIAVSAAATTAAGLAMANSVQTSTTVNQLSAGVAEAMNLHVSASTQLKGGLMILNQRLDLMEERIDILFQLAQLGCERKIGALCITSVQYENLTRAANLSRKLSLYLAGNWPEGFEETLEELRAAVVTINSTPVDLSLTDGLLSWASSAFSYFKEWVGVGMFGAALCCGLVFLLWLVCKLKAQQQRDKVVIAQALVALEQGSSPKIWLSMLKN